MVLRLCGNDPFDGIRHERSFALRRFRAVRSADGEKPPRCFRGDRLRGRADAPVLQRGTLADRHIARFSACGNGVDLHGKTGRKPFVRFLLFLWMTALLCGGASFFAAYFFCAHWRANAWVAEAPSYAAALGTAASSCFFLRICAHIVKQDGSYGAARPFAFCCSGSSTNVRVISTAGISFATRRAGKAS